MIILQMSGGLGNQMFQYAMYLRLRALGREVVIDDVTQYDEETFRDSAQKRRPKQLDLFGITYPAASREDIIRLTDAAMDPFSRIRRRITGRKSLEKRDRDFIYDPSFLEATEGYYCGNFQSPRYMEGVEEDVRRAFTFPEKVLLPKEEASPAERRALEKARHLEERIREANERYDAGQNLIRTAQGRLPVYGRSMQEWQRTRAALRGREAVPGAADTAGTAGGTGPFAQEEAPFLGGSASIHLRFGDYLDKLEIYGGICTDAYYDTAIRLLLQKDPEMTFFVFSNDIERAGAWVRIQAEREENLGRSRFVLASAGDEERGWVDLYLMTLCRNHIIANSSFSWWGSWLCVNPGKIVYAPSVWNNQADGSELRRLDIYDRSMRRISPNGQEMTEQPLVSVIITAYNVAPYIERSVASVCSQTWRNLEVIAVDDGSTDQTGTILDVCARRDERIRVFHTPNGGVAAARNEGLRQARGEYIGFVDGDDEADPVMYEAMVRGMLESGADMALVKYREVWQETGSARERVQEDAAAGDGAAADSDRGALRSPSGSEQTAKYSRNANIDKNRCDLSIDHILSGSILWNRREAIRAYIHSGMEGTEAEIVFHSAVWSKLFRRKILRGVVFPEGTSAEDIPFTTGALCRARRVLYLPEVLYAYSRGRGDSIMSAGRAQRTLTEEIPAWQTHLSLLRDAGEPELAEESEWHYYRRLLAYVEEYRRCPQTQEEAVQLREVILAQSDRILELAGKPEYGRRGDRERLKLYVQSPRAYYLLDGLYQRTVVRWRNR